MEKLFRYWRAIKMLKEPIIVGIMKKKKNVTCFIMFISWIWILNDTGDEELKKTEQNNMVRIQSSLAIVAFSCFRRRLVVNSFSFFSRSPSLFLSLLQGGRWKLALWSARINDYEPSNTKRSRGQRRRKDNGEVWLTRIDRELENTPQHLDSETLLVVIEPCTYASHMPFAAENLLIGNVSESSKNNNFVRNSIKIKNVRFTTWISRRKLHWIKNRKYFSRNIKKKIVKFSKNLWRAVKND